MSKHLGRRCVPQDMCAFGRAHNTCPLHHAFHHGGYTGASLEWLVRGEIQNENMVAIASGSPAREIVQNRVSNILRERQSNLIASLPGDQQRARLPFDIASAKPSDVTGSEPETRQE